jgi:Uma2 family endonuclease
MGDPCKRADFATVRGRRGARNLPEFTIRASLDRVDVRPQGTDVEHEPVAARNRQVARESRARRRTRPLNGPMLRCASMSAVGRWPERTFTPRDVTRMVEAGILAEDEPVELLEGRLLVVSPQGPAHASVVGVIAERLRAAYGAGNIVREEKPIELADSLPEPDVAVVRGSQIDYGSRHPGARDVVLAVEVAVTSQAVDRDKTRIYARAMVPVIWLVDVPARRIEVYEDPQSDGRYRVVHVLGAEDAITPPGIEVEWKVVDLLPR